MAADLHDVTLQRVFGLGLTLTSLGVRHPRLSGELDPLIDETDSIVRGLRAIFDLTGSAAAAQAGEAGSLSAAVCEIVDNSAAAQCSVSPRTSVWRDRSTGIPAAMPDRNWQAVLREALSNVARHAQTSVCSVRATADDGGLVMTVSDNCTGFAAGAAHGH